MTNVSDGTVSPAGGENLEFNVVYRDLGEGWREAELEFVVSGWCFISRGVASRDERALAHALEDLSAKLREVFPRLYLGGGG